MTTLTDHTQPLPKPYNTASLLPPNATQAERDLLEASDFTALFQQQAAALQQLKTAPTAQVLKHRLWEAGLEEVNRWIKDPKQALAVGQYWRGLLGTPKSVYLALDWLGIKQATLHEGELGEHFYDVRLELNSRTDRYLQATQLTQYCLPVRCRLQRVYNGQARGPLILGNDKQGLMSKTLLQAEPGITIEGFGDVRFSFIQIHDPHYQLKLNSGHSERRQQALGHYGNAFHLLGTDTLGSRYGLHQYQVTRIHQSVLHRLHATTTSRSISLHHTTDTGQALLQTARRAHIATQHPADVQASTSTRTQRQLRYQRIHPPLHFSHFEELLCPAH